MIMYCSSCGYIVDVQNGRAFCADGEVDVCPGCGANWNGLSGLEYIRQERGVPVNPDPSRP